MLPHLIGYDGNANSHNICSLLELSSAPTAFTFEVEEGISVFLGSPPWIQTLLLRSIKGQD